MSTQLALLWRGDLPLAQAFWHYAIAYGTIVSILTTAAAVLAVLAGLPDAVALIVHFSSLPYVGLATVGVWRSAGRYAGDPIWAGAAKGAVLAWAALMMLV